MTIKEYIKELERLAKIYGDDISVYMASEGEYPEVEKVDYIPEFHAKGELIDAGYGGHYKEDCIVL